MAIKTCVCDLSTFAKNFDPQANFEKFEQCSIRETATRTNKDKM